MAEARATDEMADRAIAWFVRLRADDVSTDDRERFVTWLRRDRLHQRAFIEIINLWEDLAVVKMLDFEELQPFPVLWKERERAKARVV